MPTNLPSAIIRFGTFEVNLQTGELRQNGRKVRLQEQPFQVLITLLQRPGELVTREELREKLWPSGTFVDFDHSLNAAIKRLRDALGESADSPRFIETMARRGYRFVAPVHGPPVLSNAVALKRATPLRNWVLASLLPLIALGALVWFLWPVPPRKSQVIERKLTANSSENSISSAAISPDGRYLAYGDRTGIYLKLIQTGETHAVPLPANFSADVNDWFPDGSHLLVTRVEQPRKYSMLSISIFGGTPRKLADDGRMGSVSPDGKHIAFQRFDYGREEWVMRADGTEQLKVAADHESWVSAPTWSPDGQRIAYVRYRETRTAREGSIEINEWRNASSQTFYSDNRLCPSVYWLPNGSLVYCLGDTENQQGASLWTMSVKPGKIQQIARPITPRQMGWISQFTGSDSGGALAFLRENSVSSVYVGKLAKDGARLLENKNITLDESQNLPSAWTPDGKSVLFHSDRNGVSQIFMQVADQRVAEVVASSDTQELLQPKVAPGGSEILFIAAPKSGDIRSKSSILAVPLGGGPPRTVLQDVGIWNIQCPSSPAAQCMYSITKGETSETYLFDARTGKSSETPQVDGPCNWSLSPDGSTRAIVLAGAKGKIRLRSTLSGAARDLAVDGWDDFDSLDWSADGKSMFAGWHRGSDSALLRISLDGAVSVVFRSAGPQVIGAIQSPDGELLAFAGLSTVRNVWETEVF